MTSNNIYDLIPKFENLSTSIKNINNNTHVYNDIIFFKVWRNIVLNRLLFNYIRLYNKNKVVQINGLQELRNYEEKEYISELKFLDYCVTPYGCDKLMKFDIPKNCVLKVLDLSIYCNSIDPTSIPQTVESIHYNGDFNCVQFSEFPKSIKEFKNVSPIEPYSNNPIPDNVTSISFYGYINPFEFYNLKLPLSLKVLDILILGYINIQELISNKPSSSFIPSSVTDLSICYINELYETKFIPQIPNNGKIIKLLFQIHSNCNFYKGLIPFGVKDLTIDGIYGINGNSFIISKNSLPFSINKLSIYCNSIHQNILTSSIPNSVLDLFINFNEPVSINSFYGIFPESLTKLEISCKNEYLPHSFITKLVLPSTIKHLKICDNIVDVSLIKKIN